MAWKKWGLRFSAIYLLIALWTPGLWFLGFAQRNHYHVNGPYIDWSDWGAAAVSVLLFLAPLITLFFLRDLAAVKDA